MITQLFRLILDRASRDRVASDVREVAQEVQHNFRQAGESMEDSLERGAKEGMEAAERAGQQSARKVEGFWRKAAGGIKGWFNDTAKGMIAGFGAMFAGQQIVAFGKDLYDLGTSAEETGSKFTTTFGEAKESLDTFIADFATLAGLSDVQAQEFLSNSGAIAQGMGMTQQASADFSQDIMRLAGDLQSFHDVPIEETFAALRSGITGEMEPLKRFGIVLNQDAVQMKALQMTGKTLASELTQQEKALATLTLAYEKAGPAVGDLGRTSDSTSNQARQLSAWWTNTKTALANQLMPAIAATVGWLNKNKESFAAVGAAIGTLLMPVLKALWTQLKLGGTLIAGTLTGALAGVIGTIRLFVIGAASAAEAWARFNAAIGRDEAANRALAAVTRLREQADKMQKAYDGADKAARGMFRSAASQAGNVRILGMSLGGGGGGAAAESPATGGAAAGVAPSGPIMVQPGGGAGSAAGRAFRGNLAQIGQVELGVMEGQAREMGAEARRVLQGMLDASKLTIPAVVGEVELPEREVLMGPMERLSWEMGVILGPDRWDEIVGYAYGAANDMYDAFSDAFSLIREEGTTARDVLGAVWDGLASAAINQLKQIAGARVVENIANSLQNLAAAAARTALGDAAGAGAHLKAAGTYALAAAKWGVLAGGAGLLGGGGGAGYGGGGGGRAYGGRQAERAAPAGPEVHVYLDPIRANDPVHQEVIWGAATRAAERHGAEPGRVFHHSRAGATR